MKNSKVLNQEKTNFKERNKMKNLKKLISSVLVVTLLSGSVVSLSCSAFWPFSSSKANSSSQETSEPAAQNETQEISDESSAESKAKENTPELKINLVNNPPKKEPLPGEHILKLNPYLKREIDELYNPPCNEDPAYACDKALTALKGLEKTMLNSDKYNTTQKQKIQEDIKLLKQVVEFRKAKLKGSLSDSMKKELRKIENTLKNALCSLASLATKIGLGGLVVGIIVGIIYGYFTGYDNISQITGSTVNTLISCLLTLMKGTGLGILALLKGIGSGCYSYFSQIIQIAAN